MALGRQQVLHSPESVLNTGLADVAPKHVRDISADEQTAVQEKIDAYKAAGEKVPQHLSDQLKARRVPRTDAPGEQHQLGALTDVPQPMAAGTVERGTPLSPTPDTVPEPEDGSAPDKRAQDNRPVDSDPGNRAKDPGPEFTKARELPVQPQPGERVVNPTAVEKARLAHEDEVAEGRPAAGPAVGDEDEEEAAHRREVANRQVPAPDVEPRPTQQERVDKAVEGLPEAIKEAGNEPPAPAKLQAKQAPVKKAAAKKAATRRGR